MAAVIGPIGIDHADLGDGRVAVLGFEMLRNERDVRFVHRKAVFFGQLRGRERSKRHSLREGRFDMRKREGLGQLHRGLAGIDGVDDVCLDPCGRDNTRRRS